MRRTSVPALLLVVACQAAPTQTTLEPLAEPHLALDQALLHLKDVEAAERPYVDRGFIYYTRSDDQGRRVYCRRGVAPGAEEQVLLTGDEVEDRTVASIGAFDVSPDQRWLAFSTRMAGQDRYALRLKNLQTGEITPAIEGTDFAVAWDKQSKVLYYAKLDEKNRASRVYAVEPTALTPARGRVVAKAPRLVHEERDPSKEVLVAPVADDAALFVRQPGPAARALASHGVLGFRLGGARTLEGLPSTPEPTPTDPSRGGTGLTAPPPAHPAVR